MDQDDLKVGIFNLIAFSLSFTGLEQSLKILLLIATIGYTLHKWYKLHKK
jgi:hypothetical protein